MVKGSNGSSTFGVHPLMSTSSSSDENKRNEFLRKMKNFRPQTVIEFRAYFPIFFILKFYRQKCFLI